VGRKTGITESQMRDLPAFRTSTEFSDVEKLVLEYATAMTNTPAEIPGELFSALRRHFNEAQLVELTATVAWENYRARFNHALGVESQGFSEGAYCPLPERIPATAR